MAGTGVYGSEYIVGSKKFGPLDLTLGVGWGRLSGKGDFDNPLKNISNRFKKRNSSVGEGGEFSFDNFCGEEVGIFGGLTYKLADYPLKFLAEYNPDEYSFQVRNGSKPPESPYSFGLEELFEDLHLAANYKHNDEFGFKISASLNTRQTTPKYLKDFINPLLI